jgi:hypothetical protein
MNIIIARGGCMTTETYMNMPASACLKRGECTQKRLYIGVGTVQKLISLQYSRVLDEEWQ